MKFIIYNYKTKEVAGLYDNETEEILTYGDFDVKTCDNSIEPIFNSYGDSDAFLQENSFLLYPDLLGKENTDD